MSILVTDATDHDFDTQVLLSDTPVLVDFWGEWCAPCKAIAQMFEDLAREYAGRLKFVKVELDKSRQAAMDWHVRLAPTLLLFKDGNVVATQLGAPTRSELARLIERSL
jgi:thioredoxin 1